MAHVALILVSWACWFSSEKNYTEEIIIKELFTLVAMIYFVGVVNTLLWGVKSPNLSNWMSWPICGEYLVQQGGEGMSRRSSNLPLSDGDQHYINCTVWRILPETRKNSKGWAKYESTGIYIIWKKVNKINYQMNFDFWFWFGINWWFCISRWICCVRCYHKDHWAQGLSSWEISTCGEDIQFLHGLPVWESYDSLQFTRTKTMWWWQAWWRQDLWMWIWKRVLSGSSCRYQ